MNEIRNLFLKKSIKLQKLYLYLSKTKAKELNRITNERRAIRTYKKYYNQL